MIIHTVTTPKKIPINLKVITFFNNIASGNERPTTPIIKAIAVPKEFLWQLILELLEVFLKH